MKVILTGATGYVGEGVLLAMLDDARIMPNKEQMSFIYLSGMGTTDKGRQEWQKVKSSTEQSIFNMGFKHAYGWRPCFMSPYPGQKSKQVKMQKVAKVFYPLTRLLGMACSMPEMVNAMYKACTDGFGKNTVEARDIIKLAK